MSARFPTPPAETGRHLATFSRGPNAEMRVTLASYEGHPYVALRVWERGSDGQLWPVRGKGCSVRLSEITGLVEALQEAECLAREGSGNHPHPPSARHEGQSGSRRPSKGYGESAYPLRPTEELRGLTARPEFDEFS